MSNYQLVVKDHAALELRTDYRWLVFWVIMKWGKLIIGLFNDAFLTAQIMWRRHVW